MFSGFLIKDLNPKSTIKIRKSLLKKKNSKLNLLSKNTLDHGDLEICVKLPEGENLKEWLAVNTVDFYNQTNLIYGAISQFCTPQTCKKMSAGPKYEFTWIMGNRNQSLDAPKYIHNLSEWIGSLLNSEEFFPKAGSKFPKNFKHNVCVIFRRIFRVYAHIYYSHFEEIKKMGLHRHFNTSFIHLVLFIREFNLMSENNYDPLKPTINELIPGFFDKKKKKKKKK